MFMIIGLALISPGISPKKVIIISNSPCRWCFRIPGQLPSLLLLHCFNILGFCSHLPCISFPASVLCEGRILGSFCSFDFIHSLVKLSTFRMEHFFGSGYVEPSSKLIYLILFFFCGNFSSLYYPQEREPLFKTTCTLLRKGTTARSYISSL